MFGSVRKSGPSNSMQFGTDSNGMSAILFNGTSIQNRLIGLYAATGTDIKRLGEFQVGNGRFACRFGSPNAFQRLSSGQSVTLNAAGIRANRPAGATYLWTTSAGSVTQGSSRSQFVAPDVTATTIVRIRCTATATFDGAVAWCETLVIVTP